MSSSLCTSGCVKRASSLSLLQTSSPTSTSIPARQLQSRRTNGGARVCNSSPCGHGRTHQNVSNSRLYTPLRLPKLSCSQIPQLNNGIFNPLFLKAATRVGDFLPLRKVKSGQPCASSSDLSRQSRYNYGGSNVEQPVPSTSGRTGPSRNSSRSDSLSLFVERTKNAVVWSSKRPRPRASATEKKYKRHSSFSGERQRDAKLANATAGMLSLCFLQHSTS